jgi:hypothetical protein
MDFIDICKAGNQRATGESQETLETAEEVEAF